MIPRHKLQALFGYLGEPRRRKDWYNFYCPFHRGSKQNFGINLRTSWYNCFGCGESGSLRTLLDKLPEVPEYPGGPEIPIPPHGATGDTSLYAGDPFGEPPEPHPDRSDSARLCSMWFWDRYRRLEPGPGKNKSEGLAIRYAKNRGVPLDKYEVGTLRELEGRLVFPFFFGDDVVYYQGRTFMNQPRKTLNPSEEDGWMTKGQVLWNYNNIYDRKVVVLCEGIFDSISIEMKTGIPSTCLLGKTITSRQKSLLHKAGVRCIFVFLDSDAQNEAWKLAIDLYESKFGVRCVLWNRYEQAEKLDPDLLPGTELKVKLIQAAEVDNQSIFQLHS